MIYLPADAVKNWRGREIPLRPDIAELLKSYMPKRQGWVCVQRLASSLMR
jgi:hypothetical protein